MAETTFGIGPAGGISLFFWHVESLDKSYTLRMLTDGHEHGIALPNGHFQQTFYFIAQPTEILTGPPTPREALPYLETLLDQAVAAHIPGTGEATYMYVHETAEGEPESSTTTAGARRALIYDYELRELPTDPFWDTRLRANNGQFKAVLTVERGPWESRVALSPSMPSTLSYSGGGHLLPGGLGSMESRIVRLSFRPSQGTIRRAWFGIRPRYTDAFDQTYVVNPILSSVTAYDGTDVFDDVITQSVFHTGFSAGNNLLHRVTVRSDTPADMRGEHLVLIAARVTAADTVARIRFSTSYAAPGNTAGTGTYTYDLKKEEEVTDTAWRVIEAGVCQIPFGNVSLVSVAATYSVWLNIEAERLAGTGGLRIARIWLLPAYHRIFIDRLAATTSQTINIYTTPAEQVEVQWVKSGAMEVPPIDPHQWRYPLTMPFLIFVGEDTNGWNPGHTIGNLSMQIQERWRSYRGDAA